MNRLICALIGEISPRFLSARNSRLRVLLNALIAFLIQADFVAKTEKIACYAPIWRRHSKEKSSEKSSSVAKERSREDKTDPIPYKEGVTTDPKTYLSVPVKTPENAQSKPRSAKLA
jgi:hypothetical protein